MRLWIKQNLLKQCWPVFFYVVLFSPLAFFLSRPYSFSQQGNFGGGKSSARTPNAVAFAVYRFRFPISPLLHAWNNINSARPVNFT